VEDKQLYLFAFNIHRTNSRRRTVAGVKDDNRRCDEEEFSFDIEARRNNFFSFFFYLDNVVYAH
jgi:hypothetical protein